MGCLRDSDYVRGRAGKLRCRHIQNSKRRFRLIVRQVGGDMRRMVERAVSSCRAAVILVGVGTFTTTAVAAGAFTPHQFAVSESGAATVTLPIQVPRGTAGMEPQISLSYGSQGGNGLLGLGWSLSGVSAITRCPRTLATDNVRGVVAFDANDRFCLDGQRLILTDANSNRLADQSSYGANGAEYRTERDSFARIRSLGGTHGSPERFRVWTKGGLIVEYGTTTNSRVPTNFIAPGVAQVTNRWMVERIEDRNGNYVRFQYCQGRVDPTTDACVANTFDGSAVIHYIQYTNRDAPATVSGPAAVLFRYEQRDDTVAAFHAGSRSVQRQRLKHIDTHINWSNETARGPLVRRYTLTYEALTNPNTNAFVRATNASRLASIQEVGGESNTHPLPPLRFELSADLVFGQAVAQVQAPPPPRPPRDIGETCGGVTRRSGVQVLCP